MAAPGSSQIDDLLRNADRYARVFTAGDLPVPPALKLTIVACMDSRLDLFAVLGLHLGEAHMIRNAGGLITPDALRSLTLSQSLLGTRDIMVIQHTGCGLHGDEDRLRGRVAPRRASTRRGRSARSRTWRPASASSSPSSGRPRTSSATTARAASTTRSRRAGCTR